MDVFSRTFLPAAAEAGVAIPTVSRHMPIFRRCVDRDDYTVLVTRCLRPDAPLAAGHLLLLTNRRLVVTQESRVLHRLRLHLNANLRHLNNVTWRTDASRSVIEVAATAVDGVRERFLMRLGRPETVAHFDMLLQHVFRGPALPAPRVAQAPAPTPARAAAPAPLRPVLA